MQLINQTLKSQGVITQSSQVGFVSSSDAQDYGETVTRELIVSPGPSISGSRSDDHPFYYSVVELDNYRGNSFLLNSTLPVNDSSAQTLPPSFSRTHVNVNYEHPYEDKFADLPDLLREKLLSELYNNLRGGLDLSVDAAQASQTRRMAGLLTQAERRAKEDQKRIDRIRRLKPNKLKQIGNAWLALTYGWKPLMNSIFETANKMSETHVGSLTNIRVRTMLRDSGSYTRDVPSPLGGSMRQVVSYDVTCKGAYRLKYAKSSNLLGDYTSLNPVSLAWELVPYSFVADWFVDVGGWLRNLESASLYHDLFRGGTLSTVFAERQESRIVSHREEFFWNDSPKRTITESHTYSGRRKRVFFDRTLVGVTPYPSPPVLNTKLGSGRLLNLAALLTTGLKR